jgi:methionine synthase II (cobalamin-independent)
MLEQPLRTTVIGSYPFPAWLEFAMQNPDSFGSSELEQLREDAVIVAIHDIESEEEVARRVRLCLEYVPPERLSLAPDCGLSQTARWAARLKLQNMVAGVRQVRKELEIE